MAKRNTQTSYQYEPLVTPSNWQGDERRFSIRLSQLLDELFNKFGRADTRLKALEAGGGSEEPETPSLSILDVYPVGSVYMSVSDLSPETLFGGTWERLKDTFLLAAGDTYTAGSTGGEAEHQLTQEELPSIYGSFRSYDVYNLNNADVGEHITGVFSYNENESYGTSTNMSTGKNDTVRKIHMNIGGDQPHNNMPPYLAVYMWKRTA